MAVNKVDYSGETLIDLTEDTVTPDVLLSGETAHSASGEVITGKAVLPACGTCDTAGNVAEKVVTLEGNDNWELKKSAIIIVKFANTNSATNVTLNVNGTGAKQIWYADGVFTGNSGYVNGESGSHCMYIYDGTYWVWLSYGYSANTNLDELKGDISNLRFGVPYDGVDLTQKFASEIANYSDEWAWIKARIQAGNLKGICVCDYIPITCSNGYILKAQIAGINTYKGYGNPQVGNHIDFICKELWNDVHVMNKVNYNNGNANSPSPFLASDLNYWLNSMSGNVPNSASDPSVTTEVDYTTSGVLYYLPDKLKNQIIPKRILLPSRYTEKKVLTNDNSWAWQSTGKLWIPSEVEVYGAPCWGNSGYGMGGFVQYPLFACNMNRAKLRCASKDHYYWWLLSARAGNSANFASVFDTGICNNAVATSAWVAAPVCFRI